MGFQTGVKREMDKPAPHQWNGEQDCQRWGNRLAWNNGTSVCGHVRHSRLGRNRQTVFFPIWQGVSLGTL